MASRTLSEPVLGTRGQIPRPPGCERRYAGVRSVPAPVATPVRGLRRRRGRGRGDPLVPQRHSALVGEASFCARNERETAAPTRRQLDEGERSPRRQRSPGSTPQRARVAQQQQQRRASAQRRNAAPAGDHTGAPRAEHQKGEHKMLPPKGTIKNLGHASRGRRRARSRT